MLWQRTTKKDATVWIALDADLNRVKNGDGFYMIRYDPSAGAPIYLAKRGITLDKTSMPEELPDGV
ncbi:hypothetical protein L6R53_33605, partial [Myxococcota bacterium]|nr:hypothetical protein [Myxococcota bacterium]